METRFKSGLGAVIGSCLVALTGCISANDIKAITSVPAIFGLADNKLREAATTCINLQLYEEPVWIQEMRNPAQKTSEVEQ